MKNILVTGGAGFLASNIVKFKLQEGHKVVVLDNLSSGSLENLASVKAHENITFINDDMLSIDKLIKYTKDIDIIYHFAAKVGVFKLCKEPIATINTNVMGFSNLFEALLKNNIKPRIIFASTSEVYGKESFELHEDGELLIPNPRYMTISYAISKICNESMANCYYTIHNIPITIIRIFNTIGPGQIGQYGMVVPRFVKQALNNEPITVFGDGEQRRCFCDVRDFTNLLNSLLSHNESIGQTYNIGRSEEISINQLAKKVKSVLNSKSDITHIPYKDAYNIDFVDTVRRKPKVDKLQSLANYQYQYSLEQTILDIADSLS